MCQSKRICLCAVDVHHSEVSFIGLYKLEYTDNLRFFDKSENPSRVDTFVFRVTWGLGLKRTRKRREYGTATEEVMMSLGRLPLPHVNFEPLSSGSLTGERKSSGYFWKTEVQFPMLNVYFCEVQQWLAPKTLHDCHCHPLVVLHIHISEVAYQVQLSLSEVLPVYSPIHPFNRDSSSRFFQTLLFFQAGGTPEYFVYLKDCDLYLGILTFIMRLTTSHILRLQNSRILRGGNFTELRL